MTFMFVLVPIPHDAKDGEHTHQAGLLTSGYKRRSRLPSCSNQGQ